MTTPEAGRLLRIADRLGQVAAGSRKAGRAIHAALAARGAEPRCGVTFIDLRTSDAPHWLRFGGEVQALYDLAVLPGVRRPAAIGFKDADIRRVITIGEVPART